MPVVKNSSNSQIPAISAASVCVFLLFLGLIFIFTGDLFLGFGASLLMTVLYFLVATNRASDRNILSPLNLFLLEGGVVSFGLPAVLVALRPDTIASLVAAEDHLLVVSCLISASFVALVLGYRVPFGGKLAYSVPFIIFPARLSMGRYFYSALALYGIGWYARISSWELGHHHMNADLGRNVGLVSSLLQPLSVFAQLSFFVLLSINFSKARKYNSLNPFGPFTLGIIGLEILAGIVDGSRTLMIIPLFYTLVVYHYTYRQLGAKVLFTALLVVMMVLAPMATFFRGAYYETLGSKGAGVGYAIATLKEIRTDGLTDDAGNQIFNIAKRMSSLLEGAMVVYKKVPRQIDYAEGSSFLPGAIENFVPRLLWPDKPIVIPGREFAELFWKKNIGEKYATNVGIGWVGESYYNFGWFGLGIPFLLGVLLRFFMVRLKAYAALEVQWMPRLYFVMFTVTAYGSFHYYPAGLVRGALFLLLYLSILNYSLPKIVSLRRGRKLLMQEQPRFDSRLGSA